MEATSLAASHVRQTVPAQRDTRVPSTEGQLGPELLTLVSAVKASLDDNKKDKLTHLLSQHQDIFATKADPPGHTTLIQQDIIVPIKHEPPSIRRNRHRQMLTEC